MAPENRHKAWLKFAREVLEIPLGKSKDDLFAFQQIALLEYPSLAPIIREYLRLAEKSDTSVALPSPSGTRRPRRKEVHLFDLLREKTFFPQNADLAKFASRVLPQLRTGRFDKMSRADIAVKIIEYLEAVDPRMREALEESMREALEAMSGKPPREGERRSFLTKWEQIIKGAAV